MRIFKQTPTFDFMAKRKPFAIMSAIIICVSLFFIFTKGFRYGIDFAGGIEVQVQFKESVTTANVREVLDKAQLSGTSVVAMEGETSEYLLSLLGETENTNELSNKVKQSLVSSFGQDKVVIRRVDVVGPKVGADLKMAGIYSIVYTLLAILVYIWFRFDVKFAPGAVVCLMHDALITLGVFSVLQKEFNLPILAAVLTILGYSLNDTIVVYDRIRETLSKAGGGSLVAAVNKSLNETLSRTLLTSMTTLITVTALFLKGGGIIHDFAFALLIGVIVGTYSSVFIAAPMVIAMDGVVNKDPKKKKKLKPSRA